MIHKIGQCGLRNLLGKVWHWLTFTTVPSDTRTRSYQEVADILRELVQRSDAGHRDKDCDYCRAENGPVLFPENKFGWVYKHTESCPVYRARELLGIAIPLELYDQPNVERLCGVIEDTNVSS